VLGHPWVDDVCPALHSIHSEVESEKFVVVYAITLEEHKIMHGFIHVSGGFRFWSCMAAEDVIKSSDLLLKSFLNARKLFFFSTLAKTSVRDV
jgi:hypothetical protein